MDYIRLTKQDIAAQERLLAFYTTSLKKLPKGGLSYQQINDRIYYYYIDPDTKRRTYIKKRNKNLVYDIKCRRMLEKSICVLNHNLRIQRRLLKNYQPYDPISIQNKLPKVYRDALMPNRRKPLSMNPDDWSKADYPKSQYHDGLVHLTSFGIFMRSKSEVLIAELLHDYGIPFRYESELRVRGRDGVYHTYYPDFEIKTLFDYSVYWEHFGRLDDEQYRIKNCKKITDYYHNNILPPNNLIITMDGPGGTIDVSAIERTIKGILVPICRK